MKQSRQSIIYINFSPYENAGRILDFLVDRFSLVVLFSFNFHKLNNKNSYNQVVVYHLGIKQKTIKLFHLPTPGAMLFVTLPLIVLLIIMQTVRHVLKLKRQYGTFDIYLSVNAFTAWLGNMLRTFGIVKKTIFWVWDYYPPGYPDWRIRLARWGYWKFDKLSSKTSNKTIFLNKRLIELRQEIGVLRKNLSYPVVPIGTNPGTHSNRTELIIGHMGVLKKTQGLDMLFDSLSELIKNIPTVRVEIIGSGPDEKHFKERAKIYPHVIFYGFIKDDDEVDRMIRRWTVGIATYPPHKSSPASWTDPSKIKAYISQGVPVITTPVPPFYQEIRQYGAGLVIPYANLNALIEAIQMIVESPSSYQKAASFLASLYNYRIIYEGLIREDEASCPLLLQTNG